MVTFTYWMMLKQIASFISLIRRKAITQDTKPSAVYLSGRQRNPDARAVVYDGQILTYRELNERANRIAAALRSNGVGPESVVALLTYRTTELASGILGILKAGGAYLPIGDDVPRERAEWMLKDCKADILLQSDKLDGLPLSGKRLFIEDIQTKRVREIPNRSADLNRYMIYTSGSTGAPKGVMIEQRSVIRLVKTAIILILRRKTDCCLLHH